MNKTLIGKENYLFLINDSARELEVHCNNLNLINNKSFEKYTFNNYYLIVFPNKSILYNIYLPDNYIAKYRPAIEEYSRVLKDKLIDTYDVLKKNEDTYYKTDSHINIKGSYIVYKYFIEQINKLCNLNIEIKEITLLKKTCILQEIGLGIGDLTWKSNLGYQTLENIIDTFYYSNDFEYIYYKHKIKINDTLRLLDKNFIDKNIELEDSVVSWEILSNYILYQKNVCNNNLKVIIFYDSFLSNILDLYLSMFQEIYMIKSIYDNSIISVLKPDYVFEFRIERFLF